MLRLLAKVLLERLIEDCGAACPDAAFNQRFLELNEGEQRQALGCRTSKIRGERFLPLASPGHSEPFAVACGDSQNAQDPSGGWRGWGSSQRRRRFTSGVLKGAASRTAAKGSYGARAAGTLCSRCGHLHCRPQRQVGKCRWRDHCRTTPTVGRGATNLATRGRRPPWATGASASLPIAQGQLSAVLYRAWMLILHSAFAHTSPVTLKTPPFPRSRASKLAHPFGLATYFLHQ